ncbi:MAG: response regulator [Nitrospinae bacterium]|nr:response regulator [Nitrospinota bacterium]
MNRLIEAIYDPLIIVTPEWKIKRVNKGILALLGYKEKELIGEPIDLILAGNKGVKILKTTGQSLLSKKGSGGNYEGKLLRKDGEIVSVLTSCSLLQDNDGTTDIILISKDVTEYKNAEEQFVSAIAAAEAANTAKSEFLANMSHEIRTPMNAIVGFASLLKGTILDEQQKDYVNIIDSSSHALLDILNDILDISKAAAGRLALESIDFNLLTIVEESLKTVTALALNKPIHFIFEIGDDLPHTFEGDPTRLRQILINLLGNAVKFTEKGEISLKVEREKERGEIIFLKFTVKDTGVGIPEEKKRDIFKAFAQADISTTRKYGGTGLGLSISKSIVDKMGGRIWVESKIGEGSSFIFTAQLNKALPMTEKETDPISKKEMRDKKILIIDNEPFTAKALRLFFQDIGTTFLEAPSYREGLDILASLSDKRESLPDIIMVEINIPEAEAVADYIELARKIRDNETYKGIKLMAIAGRVRIGMAAEVQKSGFEAFLPKPFSKDETIATISTLLGDKRGKGQIVTKHMAKELLYKGLTVLVAEDNAINQKLISLILKNMGCAVDLADNGQEAFEKAKGGKYDIILMDLRMPIMGGLEAAEKIRTEISKDIPIIALTAAAMKEDREKAISVGMNGFLPKPINIKELQETLVAWGKKW